MSSTNAMPVPEGFTLHTENSSHILLASNEAFLNPVQEFNRDLSVACIRVWSEDMNKTKEIKWKLVQERRINKTNAKRLKGQYGQAINAVDATEDVQNNASTDNCAEAAISPKRKETLYRPLEFTLLEALSATGLRSIRYAKEIPLLKCVIANDLSPAAVEAIKRNIKINGLAEVLLEDESSEKSPTTQVCKVQINEGDACALMYNHREEKKRVDVVDLDPYGTSAPFIDAAVQCIKDNGLLCVTCTDLAVLATVNYPEKCFSNYGGVSMKAEYSHEAALRLVLQTISTSASRYGRYIEPLLSLSIDFYVRVFVRVRSAPIEVKKAIIKASTYYICSSCQAHYEQPLGRAVETIHEASGNVNYNFKTSSGPSVAEKCPECESTLHFAGPMWSGPLHHPGFVASILDHLKDNSDRYGTSTRMHGMLTLAKEELQDPFYFTPGKVSSFFHCTTPSIDIMASALLNSGHKVSRSHACPGSLKTSATRCELYDIFRQWVKFNPVKMENISVGSPARRLLSKDPSSMTSFKKHPGLAAISDNKVKIVRYQENPTSHWGPKKRAVSPRGSKRKKIDDTVEMASDH